MIKRIIGIVAAVAILAVIIFAILGRDKYTSMISAESRHHVIAAPEPAPADTLAMPADTLQTGTAEVILP